MSVYDDVRRLGQEDVLNVVRKYLPSAEADYIETLVTASAEPSAEREADYGPLSGGSSAVAAMRSTAPKGEQPDSRESEAAA